MRAVLRRRPDAVLSVSATTRPARAGERHGRDYTFMSAAEFAARRDRGEFLEWAEVYGNLYGTPRAPVERALAQGRDVICELDIQGALAVKHQMPEAVLIFIEPPSWEELERRLRKRGSESSEALRRRLQAAYEEVKAKRAYDHIVVNDDPERAAAEVLSILEAEPAPPGTHPDQGAQT